MVRMKARSPEFHAPKTLTIAENSNECPDHLKWPLWRQLTIFNQDGADSGSGQEGA
jgi:hypothetical protein